MVDDKLVPTASAAVRARTALREKQHELLEAYLSIIAEARAAGKIEEAGKMLWNLIIHAPADENGVRMLDAPVKVKEIESGPKASPIQIGIAFSGNPKALPSIIDVTDKKNVK